MLTQQGGRKVTQERRKNYKTAGQWCTLTILKSSLSTRHNTTHDETSFDLTFQKDTYVPKTKAGSTGGLLVQSMAQLGILCCSIEVK